MTQPVIQEHCNMPGFHSRPARLFANPNCPDAGDKLDDIPNPPPKQSASFAKVNRIDIPRPNFQDFAQQQSPLKTQHPYAEMLPSPPQTPDAVDVPLEPLQSLQSLQPPKPPQQPQPPQPIESTVSARLLSGHKLSPDFTSKYTLREELGSGGFGVVVSAIRISDGLEVAVKFIFRDKVPAHGWVRDRDVGVIPMEIYILRHVRHDNVIGYFDFFQDATYFYLVMELHGTPWSQSTVVPLTKNKGQAPPPPSSSLSSLSPQMRSFQNPLPSPPLESPPSFLPTSSLMVRRTSCDLFECIENFSNFTETQAKLIFRQIVDCVHYLSSLGICHRDIKDENIVIDVDLRLKLIDFGSAVVMRPQGRLFDRFYGTVNFASPEILRGERYRAEPAEVWSLGILLYTILYGQVPFNDPAHAIAGPYTLPHRATTPACTKLLDWMLEKRWEDRATINDVWNHEWLRETNREGEVNVEA